MQRRLPHAGWNCLLSRFTATIAAAAGALVTVLAPAPASAQTAAEQPRAGVLVRSGPGATSRHNTWSEPGTALRTGGGWQHIKLFDLNRDGRDDLCGVYGPLAAGNFVYGCVLNTTAPTATDPDARRFDGPLLVASAFNGPFDPSIHPTIQLVELASSASLRPPELCGRTADGIRCQAFSGGSFMFPRLVQPSFSNANGWNQTRYSSSIGFARLYTNSPLSPVVAVCGRGIDGILCFQQDTNQPTVFSNAAVLQLSFADIYGWNQPEHAETIRFIDINNDGSTDVCGRGNAGYLCAVWNRLQLRFEAATRWTPQYSDGLRWDQEKHYATLHLPDLTDDGYPDICGRGDGGLVCEPSLRTSFRNVGSVTQAEFGDAMGWGARPDLFRSITFMHVDNDRVLDVCGLNAIGSGGSLHWLCVLGRHSAGTIAFDSGLVIRTGDVFPSSGVPIAGRIHAWGHSGICWTASGTVRCSNRWFW